MNTIDSWSSIEAIIRQRLELNEIDRRYCAVCGRQGPSLSRCFGCQMVYYCGEEHQIEDWSKEHAQKCTQLEWVALGEFIQALPAQPPLPNVGDKWPLSLKEINNWKNWFSIRTNIVNLANNTANVLKNLIHLTDKRQLTHQNAVDGLLAAVTDLLTHVLTIGKAVVYFSLQPNIHPLVIHILSGFNKIDLVPNNQSTPNLPARFHELLNMFPDNKGVELVIVIGDDHQDDTDNSSIPHAKLKPDRLIITTTGKGRQLDTFEEKRLQQSIADLLVYFNAAHLFLPSNKEQLKSMLSKQRPTLLTFEDQEEFHQAQRFLSTKSVNIHHAGTNQFSSLIIRQRPNKPNSTYSTNSYQILLNTTTVNSIDERSDENSSLLSHQRSHQSSIGIQHGYSQQQQQQQLNPGLKQVNVSTANTTTTVQPLVRSNNNMRQPTLVQRRHYSPPTSTSASPAINTTTSYRETNPTTTEMMTTTEIFRNDRKPQPKPRLSLVKPTDNDIDVTKSQLNGNLIQRIKPFFEQSPTIVSPEPKSIKQQRQSVSIPYTYQKGSTTKATCLDDIISSKNVYTTSSPVSPPSLETYTNGRTVINTAIISSLSSKEIPHDEHTTKTNTINTLQNFKPIIERRADERTIKITTNSTSSPLTMPIEIHHDQRTVMSTTTIASPPASLSSSSIENRSDERIVKATTVNISPIRSQPNETHIDKSTTVMSIMKSNSPPPPPRPPLPVSTSPSTNNEIIYTEVIKNHERHLSPYHSDLVKSPVSPSHSFIVPTKSSSISIKNPSFNIQRPSRSQTTTNALSHTNKSRIPIQSMMTPDRISLYSQRSSKQTDMGVTIKNLSECIDRVGVVFDETNRRNDVPSTGLTTVDLIREQLSNSSTSKASGSLLDKLYKSNSSTRLSTSSSRTSMSIASPRSKSQQATKIHHEQSSVSKITPTTTTTTTTVPSSTSQSIRRTVGVFLPLTPKIPHESEQQTNSTTSEQSPMLLYQNLEPHNSNSSTTQILDYTLKQHSGPVCIGIPKPFRKPTAIIEPSPVITTPITNISEPNYINLTHQDEHIYTNENSTGLTGGSSNSNSYTSKTSSIYSTSDKQNLITNPEIHYAISHIPSIQQEQTVEYDSFDDELVIDDIAKIEKSPHSNDNTDNDSFDDDDDDNNNNNNNDNNYNYNQLSNNSSIPSKNSSKNFFRSTLNRLTRSNKSLERLNNETIINDGIQELNPSNIIDTKTKKTLRSIKARHEAKKTGNLLTTYTGDDDTTSIDSNCSTQTSTSLNKTITTKSSNNRFRLFRRKIEKEFASDTEAEKHQTEQRRKKWNKKILNDTANELKTKRLLMISDDDDDNTNTNNNDDEYNQHIKQQTKQNFINDETHIYDHILNDEINPTSTTNNNTNNLSRMGKLSHETHFKSPTITLDEIRSEIQAEIAARQDIQINNQSIQSSNLNLQKKRSKSVTFLDELLSDDSKQQQQQQQKLNTITKNDVQIKPSTTIKRVEKGDARSICGALTGTGPIRGIIKAANNDITGTTAPISPSAAAAIYLSGTSVDTRCTSPKTNERTHRPLSTYTVGSARFYDGAPIVPSTPVPPPPAPSHSFNQNNNNNIPNHRPILTNLSHHSTSNNVHHKRPTAKVSPFQAKSPNESSSPSSPISISKQTALQSTSKKTIRPSTHRNMPMSHDTTNVAISSVSDGVGGVSKRLQSNF
ncbi:unnamed protein product [Rotaria sp. Silwood1]|nr:unnamed protein product [Rotaria sp. Silwood1]CAF3400363.1 unnamed protein product [Rotaria sp. Silwood1]CAF4497965.1 unnamed protein product [Rotaria sp. Silwood1]